MPATATMIEVFQILGLEMIKRPVFSDLLPKTGCVPDKRITEQVMGEPYSLSATRDDHWRSGTREIALVEHPPVWSMSTVCANSAKLGLGLLDPYDVLYFAIKHPGVQRSGPIAFVHQPLFLGENRRGLFALVLGFDGQDRTINLVSWFDTCDAVPGVRYALLKRPEKKK